MEKIVNRQHILAQIQKAFSYLSANQKEKALGIFDSNSRLVIDDDAEILDSLGHLAIQLERFHWGIELFSKLVALSPDNATYLDQLAIAYIKSHRPLEAERLLLRALEINPNSSESLINLGSIYVEARKFSEAIHVLELARKNKPNDAALLINLSAAYNENGKPREALKCIQQAAHEPSLYPLICYQTGVLLTELGDISNGIKNFRKGINANKYHGGCYWGIATAKKCTDEDMAFIKKAEAVLQESMPSEARAQIHFALGKMYDDLKRWDQAFEHYRLGNLLNKTSYHPSTPFKLAKRIQKLTTPKRAALDTHSGSNSETPIFIFGMPRTGSTLTEQIISSHRDVATVGETNLFNELAENIFAPLDKPLANVKRDLSRVSLEKYAQDYLTFLMSNGRQNAIRIIDKTPANFYYLGLILLMFPKAKLIHTVRHPLDTLLSCYFQPFTHVLWAQDLTWLGETYSHYQSIMDYWKKVLPPGRIIDVCYEELITDPETESKRIMHACGLEWQESCLKFFEKEGPIRTASTWQVRQPIYQSSRMRWVNYASHLQELASGIRPYLTTSDLETLNQHGVHIKPLNQFERLKVKLFS